MEKLVTQDARKCLCGGAGHAPQHRIIRVPSTFKGTVHHIFCLGCHREGLGITEKQAVDRWEDTFNKEIYL